MFRKEQNFNQLINLLTATFLKGDYTYYICENLKNPVVRLPKPKAERYIGQTMCSLSSNEVVLRERKTFGSKYAKWKRVKTEVVIEEILTHEILHIVIFKLEGELASYAFDNICGWDKDEPVIGYGTIINHK